MLNKTILIVDDEKDFRKKYKKLLKGEGFRIIEAPDAVEVANVLMRENANLDLILLDINIGEVDGRDIFDIIDEYAPGKGIIVTSVHPIGDQKLKIPRATDYYNKAQDESILLGKVLKILGANN